MSNALISLWRVKHILPLINTIKTLYYSLFHSHLIYALEIWSCIHQSLFQLLTIKQKATISIISNSAKNAQAEPLFKSLSILPLTDLITLTNLKLFHSYVTNHTPSAFWNTWPTTLEQRHNDGQLRLFYDHLRKNDNLYVPSSPLSNLSGFPLYDFPALWNRLFSNS